MISALAAFVGALLYRLRGGWWRDLIGAKTWYTGTHMMRLIWALPTAALMWFIAHDPMPLWMLPALTATIFASMALIGHGAHMVIDAELFVATSKSRTELLTSWWLPKVFGGIPDETWDADDVNLYNIVGMSFIGLVRNALAIGPVFLFDPIAAALYTATGLLHGIAYWIGWRVDESSRAGEVIVGGISWAAIVAFLN